MSETASSVNTVRLVQVLAIGETELEPSRVRKIVHLVSQVTRRLSPPTVIVATNRELLQQLHERVKQSIVVDANSASTHAWAPGLVLLVNSDVSLQTTQHDLSATPLGSKDKSPIDAAFRVLTETPKVRVVGILLQSSGTDGILGLRAVSDCGGITIMESPLEDVHNSATVAARRSMLGGDLDHYATITDLPQIIRSNSNHLNSDGSSEAPSDLRGSVVEAIGEITEELFKQTNHNFKHYKTSTLVRRIERRLNVNHLSSVQAYTNKLRSDKAECEALFRDLLISVTAFFRDSQAFESLAELTLRPLLSNRSEPLRIWVPGCATGEEAYSLAMLCDEMRSELAVECEIQIFATDIDDKALGVARDATYPTGIEEQLTPTRISKYFVKRSDRYQVVQRIREMCLFSMHNLISDPPFSKLDLVSCRNLLIYLGSHLQVKLLPLFHFSLNPDGYLFLGNSESLSGNRELFQELDLKHRIWQRKPISTEGAVSSTIIGDSISASPIKSLGDAANREDLNQISQRIVLGEFSPEWVVVDEDLKIISVSSDIEQFLKISGGTFENHIVSLARTGIKAALRITLSDVIKKRRRIDYDNLSMRVRGGVQRLRLTVQPMPKLGMQNSLYMVVFQKEGPVVSREEFDQLASQSASENILHQLELDLARTREDLEKSLRELEKANEELKASNEELISINEELLTTNEELQSSKDELNASNTQLLATQNDLENLFHCSQIALVFLDKDQVVKGFTPSAKQIYNFIDSDIGRPLWHLTHKAIEMPSLPTMEDLLSSKCEDVLVRTRESRIFKRRVQPYLDRSDANPIGMVVTFSDETLSVQSENRARVAIEAGGMGIWQWNRTERTVLLDEYSRSLVGTVEANRPLSARSILTKIDIEDRKVLAQQIIHAAKSGTDFSVDCRLRPDGNRVIWLRIRGGVDPVDQRVTSGVLFDVTDTKVATDKLIFSESFNRTIFENSPDCVKVIDKDGCIVSMNRFGCRLMEIDDFESVRNRDWSALWPESARNVVAEAVRASLRGEQVQFQAECPTAKGTWKWWDVVVVGVPDESGNTIQSIAVSRDITNAKANAQLLLDAAEKLRAVIEVAKIGIATVDYQSDEVICDDVAARALGLEPNVVYSRDQFHACFIPADRSLIVDLSQKAIHLGEDVGYRVEARVPSGSGVAWVNLRKRNQYDANGLATVGLIAIQDVSELRQTEADLRSQHHRLRQILAAAQAGTWDWHLEDNSIVWSDESYELFGHFNDGLPRSLEQCLDSIAEEDRPRLVQSIQQVIDAKATEWRCEYRVKAPGGWRWLYSIGEAEYGEDGKAFRMAGINLDITAQKQLEQALITARTDAELAAKARGEFLANMSHEIRTPMTAILGHTEILVDQLNEPDDLQSLEVIRRNGKHLLEIINDILDLSKIDAGRLEVKMVAVDPSRVLADVRSLMDVRAAEKNIELVFSFESAIPQSIFSDELRLRQVLINLIGNAIKFTEHGSVHVRIGFDEKLSLFSVRVEDTGIGIDEEQLVRLFDPFMQVDGSNTRRFEGTGLGLAISHRLVKALGGEIQAESKLGVGSVFTVIFYCPNASTERTKPDVQLVDGSEVLHRSGTPHISGTILIVDDRRDIRLLAQHMVEKSGGKVLTASNGQEALELLASDDSSRVDLVLMDMQMPVLDGYQAVRLLRQRGFTKPIIALTANAMVEDREKCLAAGCSDYTTKPLDHHNLIELIAKLIATNAS